MYMSPLHENGVSHLPVEPNPPFLSISKVENHHLKAMVYKTREVTRVSNDFNKINMKLMGVTTPPMKYPTIVGITK
jgi:hypothetical protein